MKAFSVQMDLRSKGILLGCCLLLVMPCLSLAYYVSIFGVSTVFGDSWDDLVPVIKKWMSGTLSFSDLFVQHNEHRILFPRIAMLAIQALTKYNDVAEMYFNWALLSLTALLIFYAYLKKSRRDSYPKLLLTFLPISLLICNFRQYESVLWGDGILVNSMIFGVVAAFALLEVNEKIDFLFVLSLAGAIVGSFSLLSGLIVWPAGFLQILMSKKRPNIRKASLWAFVGAISFITYFYEFVPLRYSYPLDYVLVHPIEGGEYFLALIGAPLSAFDVRFAVANGLVMTLIAMLVAVQAYKGKLLGQNGLSISLIVFAVLSSLTTTVGRSGFGVQQALTSRYTPITVLGIIGLYLLATSVSNSLPDGPGWRGHKSFGAHALLAVIFLGLIVSNSAGWEGAQSWRDSREIGAYVLKTYKIQSDENIRNFLYWVPGASLRIKEKAQFLEQNKLNVFSEPVINTSTLILSGSNTFFALDRIDTDIASEQGTLHLINSSQQETITFTGWAVDKQANNVAFAVFITIDGSIDIPCLYGRDRKDVAKAYRNPKFRFSGFMSTFSSSILSKGKHTISLKIVSKDRIHFYQPEQIFCILVI